MKASLTSVLSDRLLSDRRMQVATDNRFEDPHSTQARIRISGFGIVGGDSGRPRQFDARRIQVTQNVSWTNARHQLRFGWDVNVTDFRQRRESDIQGRYDFTSLANYMAGNISRYRQTVAGFDAADLTFNGRGHEVALFVQDRIDVSPRLTLNAGLRWEGHWNAWCQPPWSKDEMIVKIRAARRHGRERLRGLLEP